METAPQLGGFFHAQVGVADCEAAVILDSTRTAGSGIRTSWPTRRSFHDFQPFRSWRYLARRQAIKF
jgi:hypothetical protein